MMRVRALEKFELRRVVGLIVLGKLKQKFQSVPGEEGPPSE